MRSHRPIKKQSAKVVDEIGHNRVGITVTRKCIVPRTNIVIERGELRQPIMAVAVFFFDAQRPPLKAKARAGIEAAVVSRASGKVAEKRTGGGAADGVDPEGGGRDIGPLVRKTGPPALRSNIVGERIGAPQPSKLRIRPDAA